MNVYMDRHRRLPQNKRQVLQNCHPTRTIIPWECPLNLSLVLHTPITVSAGEVAGEEGDTPFISHTSRSTLLMSSAVNKLQRQRQLHLLNKQPPRLALVMRNLPPFLLVPKNANIHAL